MKLPIECVLKRPGGTVIDLDGQTYHFKAANDPAAAGRDICMVDNTKHAQRLLGIPEAYRIAEDLGAAPTLTTPAPIIAQAPAPAPVQPPPAPTPATAPVPPPEPSVPEKTDETDALPTEKELEAMTIEDLRAQAQIELGRKPSDKAKPPLLISQIMAVRADKAGA